MRSVGSSGFFYIEIKYKLGHPSIFLPTFEAKSAANGLKKEKKNIGNKCAFEFSCVHQYGFFIFSEKGHFKTYALNYF
jgi:hypothetical protein